MAEQKGLLGLEAHPATEEEFAYFLKLADSDDGYVELYVKDGIQVMNKPMENSPIKMIKVRYEFKDLAPELIYDVLHDPLYRRTWDEHMIEGFEICTLDATNDIGYYSVKLPFPLKNRDFVNQRSWRVNDDKEFIIFNHTVNHKDHPETSRYIRSISHITGYLLRRLDSGGTAFTYITQSDPKGWLPTWFINKAGSHLAPRVIQNIDKVGRNYAEWKAQNHPDFKPWLNPDQMTSPKGKEHSAEKPGGYKNC